MLPAFMRGLNPQIPEGYLASPLGGAETDAGVAGEPIPLGPESMLPNGMRSRPVSTPLAGKSPEDTNPLEALRSQMGVINQLVGQAPQQPYVNHILEAGSPTAGLAALGGRMVGNQTPDRVGIDPGAALQASMFGQMSSNRSQDQQGLLGRLGQMGNQALQAGDLNLRTIGLLGANGQQGSLARDNALALSTIDANGANRLGQQQLGAAYNNHMNNPANGRTAQERQRSWDALNMPMPAYTQGRGGNASPLDAGSDRPPQMAGGSPAAGGGSRTRPNLPTDTPESLINAAHQEVLDRYSPAINGQHPPIPAGDVSNRAISDMVRTLGLNPGMLRDNQNSIVQFLMQKFGPQAVDAWHQAGALGGGIFNNDQHNNALRALYGR